MKPFTKSDEQLVQEFHDSIKIIWAVSGERKQVISLGAKPEGADVYVGDYFQDSWIDNPVRFEIHSSTPDVRADKYLVERREKSYTNCRVQTAGYEYMFVFHNEELSPPAPAEVSGSS